MSDIKISAIVCTYNRKILLSYCIESLVNQDLQQVNYEIIIVDNNSTDDTKELIYKFMSVYPNIKYILEKINSSSIARNTGTTNSSGKYITFLDDDSKVPPNYLSKILSAFDEVKPTPVVVGGKIIPYYLEPKPEWFLDSYETRTKGEKPCFLQKEKTAFFSGSNMSLPKNILEEFNGFSSDYGPKGDKFSYGEDTELMKRIFQVYPLFWYDPLIITNHYVSPIKFSIKYRLSRAFLSGYSYQKINPNKNLILLLKHIIRILHITFIIIIKIIFNSINNKNTILHYGEPLMTSLGRSAAILELIFVND